MPRRPILIFPKGVNASYTKGSRPTFDAPKVNIRKQEKEFRQKWQDLRKDFHDFHLSDTISNSISEMVLVLEVFGTVDDFYKAVLETDELQFLGHEFDFTPIAVESDPDIEDDKGGLDPEYPQTSRVFLTLQNEQSLNKILSLWDSYVNKREFADRTNLFKNLFRLLKDVRLYSVEDRLRDTGFREYVAEMAQIDDSPILTEIELLIVNRKIRPGSITRRNGSIVLRPNSEETDWAGNQEVYERFKNLVEEYGGEVIAGSRTFIPEIRYHALAARIPLNLLHNLSNNTDVELLKAPQVIFFRPLGQYSWTGHLDEDLGDQSLNEINEEFLSTPEGEPIAALLDGLPLQNHAALANRLTIDSEGVDESQYPAADRVHGTAMATLITRGDLSDTSAQPLKHKLYVRPILVPGQALDGSAIEEFPRFKLPVDIIHRAVRRLFDGDAGEAPVAPGVKIINLSVGDPSRPFHHSMSAWARLIDWLSCKYNVLFIISAGNISSNIELSVSEASFISSTPEEVEQHLLKHMVSDNINRKILTPSESINAITVGSAQSDAGPDTWINAAGRLTLIQDKQLLSPISRIGFGYRGSIKPEILMPGGRKCFRKYAFNPNPDTTTILRIENFKFSKHPPGTRVAVPSTTGSLRDTGYLTGTSGAAALATRLACQIHEMLDALNSANPSAEQIPDSYYTVLIKALLVHGAGWGNSSRRLYDIIEAKPGVPPKFVKKHITPYLGYGLVDPQRVLSCTASRVTLLGWGDLMDEKAHEFLFPLPEALEGLSIEKRLTITLAWLSPTNWLSRKYRQARMYIVNITGRNYAGNGEILSFERKGVDWKTTRRGTVQHDLLVGDQAEVYVQDGNLVVKVDCRRDAPGLAKADLTKYGIAVTLEVNERTGIEIYEQVRDKLAGVRIRPTS
ncbi:S8 family peptidase [Hymenobacter sp. B81]|uniref:S8 family peptidase n=1 Tax=Hymenobacter sp. B81 TaxID=3344878 RepID=UPI0037DD489F